MKNTGIQHICLFFAFGLVLAACGDDEDLDLTEATREARAPESPVPSEEEPAPEPETPTDEDESEVPQEPEPPPEAPETPEPETCLEQEGCINLFPTVIYDTTVGGERRYDSYSCEPATNESGPERTYRVELPHAGFLALEVLSEAEGVDIDVHLLREESTDACLDRGHFTAGSYLEAGTYWVVADSWVDENGVEYSGDFELGINLVRAEDLVAHGMNEDIADDALIAFSSAWNQGETKRFEYSVTDFSLHSFHPRQWVLDLVTDELLFKLTVGHGEASIDGENLGWASIFSNVPESHQSSLGLIRTAEIYTGDYGYSMRLDGIEPGFNDNVRQRAIVVHPWYGNSPEVVEAEGWVVPTWGCATLDPNVSADVIDTIAGGALMFFWYPDPTWRGASSFLN